MVPRRNGALRSSLEQARVMGDMVADEAGHEVVAVVIARLVAQRELDAGRGERLPERMWLRQAARRMGAMPGDRVGPKNPIRRVREADQL